MLVTQDHSYSISATRGHEILNYIMKYHTYNTIWQSVRTPCNCRYLHPALEVAIYYLLGWKSGVQTVEFVYLLTNEVLGLEFMIIVDHLSPVYWKNPTLMCLMWCLESLSMARSISIIPFSSLMVPEYSFLSSLKAWSFIFIMVSWRQTRYIESNDCSLPCRCTLIAPTKSSTT